MNILLKILCASLLFGLLTLKSNECNAQKLQITGGDARLVVGAPLAAGLNPQPDFDTGSRLMWMFPPFWISKIVVSTQAPGQSFQLFVRAVDATSGTAQPEVELLNNGPASDFIRNITFFDRKGRATISYRAEAPASRGNSEENGRERHTVTYTWVSQ